MNALNRNLDGFIEEHITSINDSPSGANDGLQNDVDLKFYLCDLCFFFLGGKKTADLDTLYIANYVRKYGGQYTHILYITISFLIKLLEYQKTFDTHTNRANEARLVMIITYIIRAHIDIAAKDYFNDKLSGLFSHNYLARLESELHMSLNQSQAATVVFFDLDNFKQINDKMGHTFGNMVLRQFSEALLESTRPEDICIRYGGDEFVVVFKTSGDNVYAELLRQLKRNPRVRSLNIEFSSGHSKGLIREHTLSELIEMADQLMYREKALKKCSR